MGREERVSWAITGRDESLVKAHAEPGRRQPGKWSRGKKRGIDSGHDLEK